jgi:hypothetical protein
VAITAVSRAGGARVAVRRDVVTRVRATVRSSETRVSDQQEVAHDVCRGWQSGVGSGRSVPRALGRRCVDAKRKWRSCERRLAFTHNVCRSQAVSRHEVAW